MILGGAVTVDGVVVTKPGSSFHSDVSIALVSEPMPFVSRGGLKLDHALHAFNLDVQGVIAMDVGASTGGFTDVLLKRGAARVYAIDVGYGQLAWELRRDQRVIVMERTNIRHVASLPERIQLAVVDVSFISLRTVVPAFSPLLTDRADIVALIKPQFEAGRGHVGKKGVVRDPLVWQRVLTDVLLACSHAGWTLAGLERSPILGPAGNVEFLAHLYRGVERSLCDTSVAVEKVIASSG
jgi:23S rRNA (cytidine1920-2'-O)/16S rRNA (cytidine1409-2'-O)-methyltransferase